MLALVIKVGRATTASETSMNVSSITVGATPTPSVQTPLAVGPARVNLDILGTELSAKIETSVPITLVIPTQLARTPMGASSVVAITDMGGMDSTSAAR